MAKPWLRRFKQGDGSLSFWINDVREGKFISVYAGDKEGEAQMNFEQYKIRRDLEKEGYDDAHASKLGGLR